MEEESSSEEQTDFLIQEALTYLKNGYVLSFVSDKIRQYVLFKGTKAVIQTSDMLAEISQSEFVLLYSLCHFSLVKDEEMLVDSIKDEQYYSWSKEM